ncbi:cytochrome d ubiquinol oxidase subunit 1 [Gracilibacillus halophilus YIM-C55.5]|uniref:Cytochrome d ubiquinol oxidase subunit 1 n=1 Tax=Gracilibacillus halophilus YIM-C55.5 TaxID=1308866 RepID=N4WMN3_9BACI|nr:cytochrome d ubiquinol oxidase subunit 1 [Gracilibacillus halophilus YIM-C55.5]
MIGDFAGKYLAEYQPEKLAAMEWHFDTEEGADLTLFGILKNDKEVKYSIELPNALSILAHGNPNAEVIGLDQFPKDEVPPLYIHYLFNIMVIIGLGVTLIGLIYIVGIWLKKQFPYHKGMLWLVVITGPLCIVAIEAGWWLAEVGRQPWVLRGILRTENAATTSPYVDEMLILFIGLYLILGVTSAIVLMKMFKKNPVETELADQRRR